MKFLASMTLGVIAQATYLTSPIHELGHAVAATICGLQATIGWRYTEIAGRLSGTERYFIMWAGPIMETYGFLILTLLGLRFKKPILTGFSFGVALIAFGTAPQYSDITGIGGYGTFLWFFIGSFAFLYVVVWMVKILIQHTRGGFSQKGVEQ